MLQKLDHFIAHSHIGTHEKWLKVHGEKTVHFCWPTKNTFEFLPHWGISMARFSKLVSPVNLFSDLVKLYALHRFWLYMRHHTNIHHVLSYVTKYSRNARIKKIYFWNWIRSTNLTRSTNFYFMCLFLIIRNR